MQKLISLLIALLLTCSLALAEEPVTVYVSVTDDAGALVLPCAAVLTVDVDGDGALTIFDALKCAHAAHHPEGSAAFNADETEFGLSMFKLWGVDNGGVYGYYLNDASAWSLLDPVQPGDHVKAYAFTDLENMTDTYAFFDQLQVQCAPGSEVVLTLSAAAFDENWNPVTVPVANATITVNGETSAFATDANGRVALTLPAAGEYVISATSASMTLVAPVCLVTAAE